MQTKNIFFFLAILGWTLGLTVHLLSIADVDVSESVPAVWALHVGIFIVCVPAILDLKKNGELAEDPQFGARPFGTPDRNRSSFFKIMFKRAPMWLAIIAIGGFFYAFVNFMLFMFSQQGVTDIKDGQYILQHQGEVIKILAKQEYDHYKANHLRGFSGHWIAFYGVAAAILYPFKKENPNNN